MFNLLEQNLFVISLACLSLLFVYRYFGKLVNIILKKLGVKNKGFDLFITRVIITLFLVLLMLIVKIDIVHLLKPKNINIGLFWVLIGVVYSTIIGFLSYHLAKTTNYGQEYKTMIQRSPFYMFSTLLFFVGPAEDLLFLGIIQYAFMDKVGWIAIPIYLLVFVFYHYVNVLSGAETKKEFYGMLPFRLMISFILSMSFYLTNSLIFSFIIHNLGDTIIFIGVYIGAKSKELETK